MPRNRRRFLKIVVAGIAALGAGCVSSSERGNGIGTTSVEGSTQTTSGSATTDTTARATTDESETTATPTETTAEMRITDTISTAGKTDTATERRTAAPTETSAEATTTVPNSDAARTAAPRRTIRGGNATTTPVGTPLSCDGGLHRLDLSVDEVRYGSVGGFDLTASASTVALGDSIRFSLENTSNEQHTTGNNRKYDIQQRVDGEWRSIYWAGDLVAFNDIGIMQPPGEGFSWKFTLAHERLDDDSAKQYRVCESLSTGEYQFLYWGVAENEEAIGVRFTVVE